MHYPAQSCGFIAVMTVMGFVSSADPEIVLVGNAVPEPSGWPDDIVDPRTGTGGLNGKLFRF